MGGGQGTLTDSVNSNWHMHPASRTIGQQITKTRSHVNTNRTTPPSACIMQSGTCTCDVASLNVITQGETCVVLHMQMHESNTEKLGKGGGGLMMLR